MNQTQNHYISSEDFSLYIRIHVYVQLCTFGSVSAIAPYTTPNAGESTKSMGKSIPTYGGVDFLRFGDGSYLGHAFCRYL